ncbi:MAG TPA: DNRLRE domain-containing protein, partial [Anaerolineales bacterium]|nr:DNRLRE domain-containing protein [Anaerolineales bacterium]
MSFKSSDRRRLSESQEIFNQPSRVMKILVAVALMIVVIMNVGYVLPAPTPGNLETSAPTEAQSILRFEAEADAHVEENNPRANAGAAPDLEVIRANSQSAESYLRFTVSGISGPIQNVRLRVYSTTETAEDGPALYVTEDTWKETEITWADRPPRAGSKSGDQTLVRRHSWVEYDVTALVTGDGTYSFVLVGDSQEGLRFSSRESINGPELIITLASATPTPTSASTPAGTATAGAGNALTFTANADAHVIQASPGTNHGTSTDLQAAGDADAAQIPYIRFTVSGVSGIHDPVRSAKLRVFITKGSNDGPAVHFADSNWNEAGENGITWTVQPARLSGSMDNKETVAENSWVEYDVTAAVTGNGTYTFALVADSQEEVRFSSREGTSPPQLVVTTGLTAPTPTPKPVSRVSSGEVILVGAGDIATCDGNEDELTAQLLDDILGTVFTTGDNAYVDGSYSEYIDCYDPTWGRHKSRTKPSPGNHEYNTSGAAGYFQYFNNIPSYYAYELGSWRIYALNSEIDASASSPQVAWLEEDLTANPSQCVLAYWHQPRWSSGIKNGSQANMQTIW